ncbi:undecaprenyldiphospho-muramoylpentapeptide beta-N-acetylglucosaminyltransferase [Motilimonas cestriensis]|uniref:UDP-N-acetylglucosamine--N-acetylmuramyl-(pentapeptide) pyrophosphoryl-undecaprenol N-acetylglucosamine transferase n=1 Tax=Motilimonas cestriensis TaxID=2742685 RepID=A0ABS8WAN2_9GAMM|nr:undecaprenyldiphospho-muramoylpentapeptide beta-N-acetylglucosaminyltransferase [Motilimonas cestriensis]MCE2596099.1 undecaprenyldiphospho-muramoylpentapeptide beta-N-acetylglucosaminyltransferase [Motilimonas cestriensis]
MTNNAVKKTLLVMAGGTGGHVFPGIAVAKELAQQGWHIHWLGTADRMEAQLVPQHGYNISFIDIAGVRGNGLKRLVLAPFRIVKSILQARQVLKEQQPDVVLGMGGFASGPGGIAAWLGGVPLVLHEQNAAAGMTNRILAKFAKRVLAAFANTVNLPKAERVGNPVRQEVVALGKQLLSEPSLPLNILVVGGSLGAKVLNDTLPQVLAHLPDGSVQIRHQTGRGNSDRVKLAYAESYSQAATTIDVSDFIDDMAQAYQWADFVVCRAGALTVSELAVAGVPAIFVPLPHAVDDHQTKNALSLVNNGAAILMPQTELTASALANEIYNFTQQPTQLLEMATKAREQGIVDATLRVAAICNELTEKK